MRILLVEDDVLLGEGTKNGLVQKGYAVDWVKDGLAALQAVKNESFEIAVVDLGLPRMPGIDLIREIRAMELDIAILILTARDSVNDRVQGLDTGADDYLTKPFDLEELSARLRALQRRAAGRIDSVLQYGELALDPAAHTVMLAGNQILVSRREFALLNKLLENPGRVLSREQLNQCLYGWDDDIDSNAIEVHIHNIRKKLGGGKFIRTIRGVGYMVEKPADNSE
ncbi:MAG: DNA-binding response regulator [marine bacterium B5-7]|nr:MAG: DNA-binding response regulator [marine bacterium B5-7]